jgi:hypothetical protein
MRSKFPIFIALLLWSGPASSQGPNEPSRPDTSIPEATHDKVRDGLLARADEIIFRCRTINGDPDLLTPVERDNIQIRFQQYTSEVDAIPRDSLDNTIRDKTTTIGQSCPPAVLAPMTPQAIVRGETAASLYPWPPPAATARLALDYNALMQLGSFQTLASFNDWLSKQLIASGFSGYKYWGAPGGFAIATSLETITDDGRRVDKDGFVVSAKRGWSLVSYLYDLTSRPAGRARVFIFTLTNDIHASETTAVKMETVYAKNWLTGGAYLLSGLEGMDPSAPLTSKHFFLALVYEFRKQLDKDPVLVKDGQGISMARHFSALGLQIVPSTR